MYFPFGRSNINALYYVLLWNLSQLSCADKPYHNPSLENTLYFLFLDMDENKSNMTQTNCFFMKHENM